MMEFLESLPFNLTTTWPCLKIEDYVSLPSFDKSFEDFKTGVNDCLDVYKQDTLAIMNIGFLKNKSVLRQKQKVYQNFQLVLEFDQSYLYIILKPK